MRATQDALSPVVCRLARERLLELARECRHRGMADLAAGIEDGATRGIDETSAKLLVLAPVLKPMSVHWEWIPNDWVVVMGDADGSYLAYWTWLPGLVTEEP